MKFYIATDIHYLAKSLTDNGEGFQKFLASGDGKQLPYIDEIVNAFTLDIQNTKPDVLIISGDLTNNGEKVSHEELSKKLKLIEKSGTSVYVIPGNHDVSNPFARTFKGKEMYRTDYISPEDFSDIYADFGYEEAVSKDKDTLSYLAAPSEDVWILMLDTNQYKDNVELDYPQTGGELSQNTLNWIKECSALAGDKGASLVTVMHHNILNHSDVIRKGYTLNNNIETIKVLRENKLNLVLSGHVHIQDICSEEEGGEKIYDIVTGSMAVSPHHYGILKYTAKDNSIDYSTASVDVEAWAKANNIKDENLNNFKKYSENYFGQFAYNMAYENLSGDTNYSEDQVKLMSETMRTLNVRYFAGIENLNSKDVINSEGFKLWGNYPEDFFKAYVNSICNDKDTDDNKLHMELGSKE
jgi:3',5'-cyclic AMP phosphodiesterase CpdA